jgi:hypothetical protein
MKYIIYDGPGEILITTEAMERAFLKQFFKEGMGRDQDEYERDERDDTAVSITSTFRVE